MQERQNRETLNQYIAEQKNINGAEIRDTPVNGVTQIETIITQEGILLLPLVFVMIAWSLIYILPWALWKALRYRIVAASVQPSHQKIPCVNCRYFNADPYLQCAVQPSNVLKTEAKDCPDYCAKPEKLA